MKKSYLPNLTLRDAGEVALFSVYKVSAGCERTRRIIREFFPCIAGARLSGVAPADSVTLEEGYRVGSSLLHVR